MQTFKWGLVTLVVGVTVVGGQLLAQHGVDRDPHDGLQSRQRGCSEATLRGVYGIQMTGTRPSAPGGPIESVIGVVVRRCDGKGNFTQRDNVKGAISGFVADREGFGTYEVNEDCTATTRFEPGPGVVIEERLVVVDGGREAMSIVSAPQPVMMSTIQKKMMTH
jgi:hypothetical protein